MSEATPVRTEIRDGVALLTLDRGVTNALSLELLGALGAAIRRAEKDPDVTAAVLASANDKFLSIGFDLPVLLGYDRDAMAAYARTYDDLCLDLYASPLPAVAAISGHAVAGGCILTLCCDERIVAEGRRLMGLNEVDLGVPVPFPADRILRSLVSTAAARLLMEVGDLVGPDRQLELGLVDAVVPVEDVRARAEERARLLGSKPPAAFRAIKRNRVEPVVEAIRERLDERRETFLDLWFEPETRTRLAEAAERF